MTPNPTSERQDEKNDAAEARKERRIIGGRWQDPAKARKAPRADRTISVRLTQAELDAQIEAAGLNRNRALRIAARRIGGFLEVDAATLGELRGINRQLAGGSR